MSFEEKMSNPASARAITSNKSIHKKRLNESVKNKAESSMDKSTVKNFLENYYKKPIAMNANLVAMRSSISGEENLPLVNFSKLERFSSKN